MASTITKKIKAKISGLKLGYMNTAVTGLVTESKEIRSYMKNDVRGEVFSFVLVDDSAEMRVSVFGKDLRSIWEVCNTSDAVRIAGGMVKTSDPRYNSTNNPMEVSLSVEAMKFRLLVNGRPPEEVMTKAGKRINVAKEYAGAVVLGCTCSEVRRNSDDTEVTTLTDWYTNAKQSDTEFQPLGAPCPSGAKLYRLVPSGESQLESTRIDWSTQADERSRMSCEDFSGSSRNQ
uniref:OB domain-containing protein n=1 Tax=Macrostomum lignano TaxID=282301 RepID=A0A1I8G3U5_9PLAT